MVKTGKPENATSALARTAAPAAHQRMLQKNFFSRNGFSEAGTGMMSGSSRMWASQYAIRSAAALETWGEETEEKKLTINLRAGKLI